MSLRSKIFATIILVTMGTLILVGVLVTQRLTLQVRSNLFASIQNAADVVNTVYDLNRTRLIEESSRLANDPRLRASLATRDKETIAETIGALARAENAPMLLVLSPGEEFLAGRGLPAEDYGRISKAAVVIDALNGFESADYWLVKDQLLVVAATPVITGSRMFGIIILGRPLGENVLNDLAGMTGSQFALRYGGTVHHNTYRESRQAIDAALASLEPEATPMDFSTRNMRFIGLSQTLLNAEDQPVASLVIYRSYDQELEALSPLRTSIYLIALGSIGISLLASFFLASGVTRPVERLATSIRNFGGGNYAEPIEVTSNDEVGVLAASFEEMRQSLLIARDELLHAERLSTVGRMANGIIHDFKQPITTIRGYTELICAQDMSSEKRMEFGAMILGSVQQMMGMINDLLDFARGKATLHLEQADLNKVVQNAVSQLQAALAEHQVEVNFTPGKIDSLGLDQLRIQRVIENLISNAGEAISGAGKITLETRTANGGVDLIITDTGSGVPEELRETLFEPFVTLGKPSGTGLGLAVAKNIVEEHGGTIQFQSETDIGSTFRIHLPANGV